MGGDDGERVIDKGGGGGGTLDGGEGCFMLGRDLRVRAERERVGEGAQGRI